MNLKRGQAKIVSAAIILFLFIVPLSINFATAQTITNYWITVKPVTDSIMYTQVGSNWTLSFNAMWSYGKNAGQLISNATVKMEVTGETEGVITVIELNSTSGTFFFNYSSSTPDKITFKPIELVTEDGKAWGADIVESEGTQANGLESLGATVWWDTFHVSLLNYNTTTQGTATVMVNVTYLLLPEDGLTLPSVATYSGQTFLPKLVHNATVTINGVKAEETSAGIFNATVPIWLPTAYIHVGVSQEKWITTHTGFSFSHNVNEPLWEYAVLLGAVLIFVGLMFFVVRLRKSASDNLLQKKYRYAVLGGALLIVMSIISFYWGLVGLDSTLHGFDWIPLTLICFLSFVFGLTGAIFSMRRKNLSLVIFAVTVLMATTSLGVKSSLDMYQLANPWLILGFSLVLSIVTGILVTNADEAFNQHD